MVCWANDGAYRLSSNRSVFLGAYFFIIKPTIVNWMEMYRINSFRLAKVYT